MLRVCAGTDVAGKERTAAARAWYGCYGSSWLSSRWSSAYRQHCRINWFTEIPVFLCSSTNSQSIHSVKRTVLGMLAALNFRSRSGWNIDFTTLSALNYYKIFWIHSKVLTQILSAPNSNFCLVWRKNLSPLAILPIFKQGLISCSMNCAVP